MLLTTERISLQLPASLEDLQGRCKNIGEKYGYNIRRFYAGDLQSIYIERGSIQTDLVLRYPSLTMLKVSQAGKNEFSCELLSNYFFFCVSVITPLVIASMMIAYGYTGIFAVLLMLFLGSLGGLYIYFENRRRTREKEELKAIMKDLEESFLI